MSDGFRAIRVSRDETKKQTVEIVTLNEADLMDGDVTLRVDATTVNYKDGLAITGKGAVIRHWPMVPGIDLVGTVTKSTSAAFKPGDTVLLNGFGVGETHWGAYAGMARLKCDWLIPLPAGLSPLECMAIGTAGYTAMLAVMALERHGLKPDTGPLIVTGANGGVGSIAIALLSALGYRVIASTGRPQEADFLKGLGAAEIIDRAELSQPGQPVCQGTLGRRHRRGRQPHARQCAGADSIWRRRRRLRTGARQRSGDHGVAVHFARRLPARHRFGDGAKASARRSLAPPRRHARSQRA